MKIVSFAALDTLISVVLLSSAAVPVATDLVRKRSQVNHLSGQQKREENYADHDVRHRLAETSVATEVVDGTVARMLEASTSMSSSLSMSGSMSRSLMSMSMPARCSFCAGGMPEPDLVLPTDNGATCGMAQAYASTLEVSDSNCQVALLAESICCPAHDIAGTSTPKSYAPTPEPASYAPTPASYAPTPELASYDPKEQFIDDGFPFAQTIFFDIVVESRRLRKALVPIEGLRTKEVLACGPNHQPRLEILFVMIEERMRAIKNCLQRHLSTTRLIRHMYIIYSLSMKHE
jgi:hypothetical protein